MYGVRVAAYNSLNGYSAPAWSVPRFETPRTEPGVPRISVLYVLSGEALKIAWKYPSDDGGSAVTLYSVEWSLSESFTDFNNSGGSAELSDAGAASVSNAVARRLRQFYFNIDGLVSGLRYYVRVQARNDRGWGNFAPIHSGVPTLRAPGAPYSIALQVLSEAEIRVIWTEPTPSTLVYGGNGGMSVEQYLIEWD